VQGRSGVGAEKVVPREQYVERCLIPAAVFGPCNVICAVCWLLLRQTHPFSTSIGHKRQRLAKQAAIIGASKQQQKGSMIYAGKCGATGNCQDNRDVMGCIFLRTGFFHKFFCAIVIVKLVCIFTTNE
jgi:hypothetical protein